MKVNVNDKKVDVIIATYNGATFLKEQLISIGNQSYKNLNIIISDDNSTDATISIAQELPYNIVIYNNPPENGRGVISNFNNALIHSNGDYIFFCDQDDVWLPNKIETLMEEIFKIENDGNTPALVFSDMMLIDDKGEVINKSFYTYNNLNPENNKDIRFLHWKSTVYGCTMLINRKLLNISGLTPQYFNMHDHWYAINAAKYGSISYCPQQLVLYRQHDSNVVGSHNKSLLSKVLRFKKTLSSIKNSAKISCESYSRELQVNKLSLKIKFNFILTFVFPYIKERLMYSLFFIIFFLVV
ncbi:MULTISPECIES: glycosyltransferase family 2 protein [Klebsiella pneumoniae complex]|uniref:glycosyltransferase family 2 protein n=1 Tax=Klebsiella pneumoniae complex TaxID=3390273 RepID=UPI0021A3C455|nr:glycosyltransferase family 2 protein [Klebsiella variicola]UWS45719.1 glycosyltransferase family 2 protein [Klebsiella variicola]HDH1530278.1 glycosyltransferase family 2 protein [Klebsiella quasipneumoniae subsp. similipneumoniae]